MKRHDVSRVVMLSALGAGNSRAQAPAALRLAFRTLLRQVGKDKAKAEELLRRSDLDWTLVYPPSLVGGPRTGAYRHGGDLELRGMPKITRADVAEFMLTLATDSSYSRMPVVVSS
jgi:putative NADH-flavin reductase